VRYYDVRHLVYKRSALPKEDAGERRDVEDSIRFLYRWMSDRDFQRFLFLADCMEMLGRAMASILRALGLNALRWKIAERLKGAYSG